MRALPDVCTPHLPISKHDRLPCRIRMRILPAGCIPQKKTATICRRYRFCLPCPHPVPTAFDIPMTSPSRCSLSNKVLPSPPIRRHLKRLLQTSSCHRHRPAASFCRLELGSSPAPGPTSPTRLTISPLLIFLPLMLSLLRNVLDAGLSLLRLSALTVVCLASSLISIII